ncbi:MAG TPA: UBP-type zinc finger domain-containing protein [Pseudonocardiaceae bacterium]|nr:UBP-type zinc finger domain-containing protein [Pseudonocardiaceae bacterium]
MTTADCAHLAELPDEDVTPTTGSGCQDCLAANDHSWVHLRLCLACGHVGCCDSSPHRHATAHYHETSHPLIRSFEPGETWRWCYVDERQV